MEEKMEINDIHRASHDIIYNKLKEIPIAGDSKSGSSFIFITTMTPLIQESFIIPIEPV